MRRVRVLLLGVLFLLASACRIDATVEIAVDADGSGTVSVLVEADAETIARIPDAPASLALDDLEDAGWVIEESESDAGGGLRITAAKPFASPADLDDVLAEIAGPDVLFQEIDLSTEHSFDRIGLGPATTRYLLTGVVDPTPDIAQFADERLPADIDLDDRTALLGDVDDLNLTVRVRLPDEESSESGEPDGESVMWEATYGDEPLAIDAASSVDDILPRVWAVVALLAGLLFIGLMLSLLATFVLAKIRTPKGRRRRDVRRRQDRAATREQEANRPRRRMLRLLIVDVHGVIVRPTDPLEGLLLPMIMEEQPDVEPDRVRELHRQLVLGRASVEEFWDKVGLGPVAEEIETRYLSSFRLVPGLHPFLDRMSESRLPVAAVGNQPAGWGDRLRRMASLDNVIDSWMVSGDVGSPLPEPALFEATRRTMSVDLFDCFYLSNVPEHLDAAEALGMATGLFVTGAEDAPDTNHTVVRGFEDLLRSRGN